MSQNTSTRRPFLDYATMPGVHSQLVFMQCLCGSNRKWQLPPLCSSLNLQSALHQSLNLLNLPSFDLQAEVLWLMAAKEKWLSGEVDLARQILSEAYTANSDSENIFLAAFKLEFENNELARGRLILDKARASESGSTQRVWMKSAIVERELGDDKAEHKVLQEGIARFAYFDKLWLMLGQLEERRGAPDAARQVSTVQKTLMSHVIR